MSTFGFGDRVLVVARIVPLVGSSDGNGGMVFRQAIPPRDRGRVDTEFDDELLDSWPGSAVPLSWVDAPERFELEPTTTTGDDVAYRRLRRLTSSVPGTGVVVGFTHKQEGTLRDVGGTMDLLGPGRRIELYEVAVPSRSRSHLVLVHEADLRRLPN